MTNQLVIIDSGNCLKPIKGKIKKRHVEAKANITHAKDLKYTGNNKYLLSIQDPVKRFISVFNFRLSKCITNDSQMCKKTFNQPGKDEIHRYRYWGSIRRFAEDLYNANGEMHPLATRLIQSSMDLRQDISFYLADILPLINRSNCKIIRYEHFCEDATRILGINLSANVKFLQKSEPPKSQVSSKGLKNLKLLLTKDYKCFRLLKRKNLFEH